MCCYRVSLLLVLGCVALVVNGFKAPSSIIASSASSSSSSSLRYRKGWMVMQSTKPAASPFSFFGSPSTAASKKSNNNRDSKGVAAVKTYFQLWNERKMAEAIDLFTEDCQYEDTLYPKAFQGKENLRKHLLKVADALPDSFGFVLDEISDGGNTIGVQWHVSSDGKQLPFTRGTSIYKIDPVSGKINYGFDVPEPTVKSGSVSLAYLHTNIPHPAINHQNQVLTLVGKLLESPIRVVPFAGWLFYCYFLFISNYAPGPNALALDPATWQEVRDLSLNFWLVMPAIAPNSSPVLHPVLEGVFNLLLAWAAMFAGFMIDGRAVAPDSIPSSAAIEDKKEKNAFLPYVLGMQLLTNAVLLPYLVFRPTKPWTPQSSSNNGPLTKAEAFGESKTAPLAFLAVGVFSIYWAIFAREADFGDLSQRIPSFIDLLSSDRLTFSFVVDLLYFWVFQGWLMDSDYSRRVVSEGGKGVNLTLAKAIPFFGLAYYLVSRPPLDLPAANKQE